mmetsp:Transcript_10625/g.27808  ORF Transcript_10625/g.27808 Transcript_10625/m.27808 type:complete len:392 (-) Transcript_10625:418-1593(-)
MPSSSSPILIENEVEEKRGAHTSNVWSLSFSACLNLAVTTSNDCTAAVWRGRGEKDWTKAAAVPHPSYVTSCMFHPTLSGGRMFATGCADGRVRLCRVRGRGGGGEEEGGREVEVEVDGVDICGEVINNEGGGEVRSVSFSPSGTRLAVSCYSNDTLYIYNVQSGGGGGGGYGEKRVDVTTQFRVEEKEPFATIPPASMLQCQWHMFVHDVDVMYFLCLTATQGATFFEVKRDDELIKLCLQVTSWVYKKYVRRCLPPPPNPHFACDQYETFLRQLAYLCRTTMPKSTLTHIRGPSLPQPWYVEAWDARKWVKVRRERLAEAARCAQAERGERGEGEGEEGDNGGMTRPSRDWTKFTPFDGEEEGGKNGGGAEVKNGKKRRKGKKKGKKAR